MQSQTVDHHAGSDVVNFLNWILIDGFYFLFMTIKIFPSKSTLQMADRARGILPNIKKLTAPFMFYILSKHIFNQKSEYKKEGSNEKKEQIKNN